MKTSPDCLKTLHNHHFECCSVITFVVDVAVAVMVPLDGAGYYMLIENILHRLLDFV